ncbi:MAG: hypothetical protein AAF621_03425 [Pseudomonadota bacterium]
MSDDFERLLDKFRNRYPRRTKTYSVDNEDVQKDRDKIKQSWQERATDNIFNITERFSVVIFWVIISIPMVFIFFLIMYGLCSVFIECTLCGNGSAKGARETLDFIINNIFVPVAVFFAGRLTGQKRD